MPFMIFAFFVSFLTLNLYCSPVLAASITVSPSGSGDFSVLGEGMNGVAGIEINLGYDSASLATPSVTQGSLVSGALLTANTSIPGTIRIAIIKSSPFIGSGQIVAISFAVRNGTGGITSISARLIDSIGANLPVQTIIASDLSSTAVTPINPPTDASTVQTPAGTMAPSSAGTTILGAITMPGDNQPKIEPNVAEPVANVPPSEPPPVPGEAASQQREPAEEKTVTPVKVVEPKIISYGSVLERFRKYKGDRTPTAMMALFEKPVAPELRQDPAISVSDGSTSVRIYANLPKGAGTSPNFRLSGVELISVAHDGQSGELVLEVIAKKNGTQASVTILTEEATWTVPLTIVPPTAKVSSQEAAFADFLKDMGSKKPRFDLNNDGVHDFQDDYIYTGQYLIKKAAPGNKSIKQ